MDTIFRTEANMAFQDLKANQMVSKRHFSSIIFHNSKSNPVISLDFASLLT